VRHELRGGPLAIARQLSDRREQGVIRQVGRNGYRHDRILVAQNARIGPGRWKVI